MVSSYFNSNKVIYNKEKKSWFYLDGTEVDKNNPRKCKHCKKETRKDGHDACIGELPDVEFACCGHGIVDHAYVWFNKTDNKERKELYRKEALCWMENVKLIDK